jgi:hypothetical protein
MSEDDIEENEREMRRKRQMTNEKRKEGEKRCGWVGG